MSDLYRTFIALKIHPEPKLLDLYKEMQDTLFDEAIKWVESMNLHLTLKFLGDTSAEQIEKVKEILNNISHHFYAFQFVLKGVGYFKSNGQPRILFTSVVDSGPMQQLFSDLDISLAKAGFEREGRGFKPHLTLARIKFLKDKKQFYSLVEKFKEFEIQTVNVSEIIYYQSILSSAGPKYIPLKKVQLKI